MRTSTKRFRAPKALELRSCKPSALGLEFERNVADFVQKKRAAVGELKAADALRDRAGERAFLMAEKSLSGDRGWLHSLFLPGSLAARA